MRIIQGVLGPEDVKREVTIEMTCVPTYLDDEDGTVYVTVSRIRAVHSDGHNSVTEWNFSGDQLPGLRIENAP